jgi:hypothetical protein
MAGMMLVGRGLKAGGLFTAETTTASTLKIMSTRKAKLHMPNQASPHWWVATMNQFTVECWLQVTQSGRPNGSHWYDLPERGVRVLGWIKRIPWASYGLQRPERGPNC